MRANLVIPLLVFFAWVQVPAWLWLGCWFVQ
jgi:hypothetical protein